jgi:hypothetical protein
MYQCVHVKWSHRDINIQCSIISATHLTGITATRLHTLPNMLLLDYWRDKLLIRTCINHTLLNIWQIYIDNNMHTLLITE